jgi:histidinol-phosphate aminotransferase
MSILVYAASGRKEISVSVDLFISKVTQQVLKDSAMTGIDVFLERLSEDVRSLPRYNSGLTAEHVRKHYGVQEIAKLGSNENPYGTGPGTVAAIAAAAADCALYPDPSGDTLRAALSSRLGIPAGRIALGNGSEDLIAISAHTFLSPGDEFVTILPSFGLHVLHAQSIGARLRSVPVLEDYSVDIDGLIAALAFRPRMLIFSNPSNPTGRSITAGEMQRLLAAIPSETLLVFDEAYFEYAATDPSYPAFLPMLKKLESPWLMLRTFSKAYGLAGLRVGYGIASDESLVDLMDRIRSPFNVNRLAQAAAIAALEETGFVRQCVSRTIEERERVMRALHALGYRTAKSCANFLFVDAQEDASALAARLLSYGVIVKPWREPGFTEHMRVSVGSPRANDQFLNALDKAAERNTNAARK